MNARRFCSVAALLLALATAIGAAGAHALKARLDPDHYAILQTAVHYQFFHALGLLGLALALERRPARGLQLAAWMVLAGTLLFSGSLYLLIGGAPRLVGVLTPLGGLALIGGWCVAALTLWAAG